MNIDLDKYGNAQMTANNIDLLKQRIAEFQERIDRQLYPSVLDLEELRRLKDELNSLEPQGRKGIEIVIDAWIIDIESREYAELSTFFYTSMPLNVQDIFAWFEGFGFRLQRKAEGLDRLQISGMRRSVPPGATIHTDWQAHLDRIMTGISFQRPKTTGHHKRLTPQEREMRRLQRNQEHKNLQERLDLEFSE